MWPVLQNKMSHMFKNPFKLSNPGIFTDKMILALFIPILIEDIMIAAITIADTAIVAYAGEAAVAGVSLVATINTLMKQFALAISVGSGVIVAQYIGKKEYDNAGYAMKIGLYSAFFSILIISVLWMFVNRAFLSFMFIGVEEEVLNNAVKYMSFSLISYPLYAIYYSGSAFFRAKGNGKWPMVASFIMMGCNVLLKAVLVYGLKLGVVGAGISTVAATVIISCFMLYLMMSKKSDIYIRDIIKFKFDFNMIKRIFGIGIPTGVEKSVFQMGLLMLHRVTASFGTAALTANAIAKSITPLSFILGQTFSLVIINMVGRCMGAGKPDEAEMYIKHILKMNYLQGLVLNGLWIALATPIVNAYGLSSDATRLSIQIFTTYCIGSILFYPLATVLPFALRGAGDAKFCMVVSTTTMFTARVAMAYVFGIYMNMGVFGVWLSMILEWLVKGAIFTIRFVRGKWKEIKVI